jgi:hypothetical protein
VRRALLLTLILSCIGALPSPAAADPLIVSGHKILKPKRAFNELTYVAARRFIVRGLRWELGRVRMRKMKCASMRPRRRWTCFVEFRSGGELWCGDGSARVRSKHRVRARWLVSDDPDSFCY